MNKYRNRQEWRNILEQQKQSGMSVARFCRENEIYPNSFYNFRKREAERGNQAEKDEMVELPPQSKTEAQTPQALIRVGSIEIIPGNRPEQEVMTLLFKSALEAFNASLR